MMLVLGFAASAFAVHADIPSETQAVVAKGTTQLTLGGSIRVRGEVQDNTLDFDDDDTDRLSYYDQRVRLRLQADVSKNTTGVVHLEHGTGTNSSDVEWGTTAGEGKGSYAFNNIGNLKQNELFILEAWIQHKGAGLLGVPAGFKVGHMPVKLGYGLFYDHSKFGDDAINVFIDPMKDLHVEFLTAKLSEGAGQVGLTGSTLTNNRRISSNDGDLYSLLLSYNLNKDTSIGFDATYIDVQNSLVSTVDPAEQNDSHLWNFGLRGQTKIAGFGIRADVELQRGTLEGEAAGAQDRDYSGYAYLVGIDYTLAPVKLTLEYAYGSGNDPDADADDDIDGFQTLQSGIQKYTYVYDYRTATAGGPNNSGITNTWYIKVGASADIMKDLNALVNVYYLRASEDITATNNDKDLGIEVDGKITYKIDRNLVYWVEGGYLFAGDAVKAITGGTTDDDAYAVRHGIELSF
ncbi:MAG: alginate export family protein [Nitrospirota bacterium]